MFDRIHIPLVTKRINGTLLNNHNHSIFRDDPSPLVDAAWDRIAAIGTTSISTAETRKIGLDPTDPTLAKYPLSFGLGPDAYIAELDIFHQIHCLNALRKTATQNFPYYFGSEFPNSKPDEAHTAHVSHCIHILLQNLMCKADVDIVTHRWLDVRLHPFPDFNVQKRCRDFDAILKWQEDHIVDFDRFMEFRKPEDIVPIETDDEFKRLFSQQEYLRN
ncbi:hypothetical protein MMC08_003259 [Hypocenomyce scalaris]|nr:hypothetical protein [Hypocenomyce scalaris]